MTTNSPTEHFGSEGEVGLLLDPCSQSTELFCGPPAGLG